MKIINFSNYKINENSDVDVFDDIKTIYSIDLSYDIKDMITELKKFCIEYNIKPTSDFVDYFVNDLVSEILSETRDFYFLERNNYESFNDYFKMKIENDELEELEQIIKKEKSNKFNL
jgi:hypothetical protein